MKQAHSYLLKQQSGMRLFCVLALVSLPLAAQAVETRGSLLSRMDRIEQRLSELNAAGPAATENASPLPAGSAARYEVSLAELRDEVRDLRGQLEQIAHTQTQLRGSVQRLEQDMDLRLSALEDRPAMATPNTLDTIEFEAPKIVAPVIETPAALPAAPAIVDDGKTPNELYQAAFDALNAGEYAPSEAQFSQFVARYPDHSLVGNAYYWLGETLYVQGQHDAAAEQFRKGFQVLPEGPKAPDNLLRLGMTLDVLGRKDESCIILKQLLEKYKGRSESVLRKATRESEKLGCS